MKLKRILKWTARAILLALILAFLIGPDGKPLLMEQTSEISGSGMGQTGGAHTVVTYSDYRAIGRLHK
jgi:hypothetical protein